MTAYPYIWVPISIAVWFGWRAWRRRRHAITWTGPENPYPGLAPYDADRAAVFFGRDRETAEVLQRIDRAGLAPKQRLVPLVGPSGSGKSSLLRAGVLPRLSRKWRVIGPFQPGPDVFLELAVAAGRATPAEHARTAALLRDEAKREAAPELFLALLAGDQKRVVLVVDQLEDLFTLSREEDRGPFLNLLHAALVAKPALSVLATMRPEFLATATGLHRGLFDLPVPVASLDPRRVRTAIEGPAEAAGVSFEPGLVDLMVAEATVGDALPLLGHLLQRLFSEAEHDKITTARYDAAGRVGGAIAAHADTVHRELQASHPQDAINQVLLRFMGWERDGPVRRTVTLADLDDESGRIVAELRQARLVTDLDAGRRVLLSHDALFRHWRTLADLAEQHRTALHLITLLEQRAAAWAVSHLDDDLLRGRALQHALESTAGLTRSPTLERFFAASASGDSDDERVRADRAAAWAQELAGRDLDLAIGIAATAVRELTPSPIAAATLWGLVATPELRELRNGHDGRIITSAWLPDGQHVRTVDDTGKICTWTSGGRLVAVSRVPVPFPCEDLALSPDGSHLLVGEDKSAQLWRLPDGVRVRDMPCARWGPGNLSWSRADRFEVIEEQGLVALYDLSGGEPMRVRPGMADLAGLRARSPRGDRIAMVDEEALEICPVGGGPVLRRRRDRRSEPVRLVWSPRGDRIAVLSRPVRRFSGSGDCLLTLYDQDGVRCSEWVFDGLEVFAWSPDGRTLAVAVSDDESDGVEFRDAADGTVLQRSPVVYRAHSLNWSPDGRHVLVCALGATEILDRRADTTVTLASGFLRRFAWAPDHRRAVNVPNVGAATVVSFDGLPMTLAGSEDAWDATWAPDGRRIAVLTDGWIAFWAPGAGTRAASSFPVPDRLTTLCWSPGGQWIAATESGGFFLTGEEAAVTVLDARTGQTRCRWEPGTSAGGPLAWATDDSTLAVGGTDEVVLCSVTAGDVVVRLRCETGKIETLAWSPAGDRLAVIGRAGGCIRDVRTGDTVVPADLPGSLRALCWSPDGTSIAASENDWIHLWDAGTGVRRAVLRLPPLHASVHLSWDDELRSTGKDGTVLVWTVPGDPPEAAGVRHRPLNEEERRRFGLPPPPQPA
ncbi:AAA family ATPase [Actinoplanes sp. NPDC024001]|uniref:NACHT and WD repeat domain-containing protein n=1 Tax=Actinoplanes sp. NPDC024001 TaxID=3154598 RepID=UPI0033CD1850